MAMEWLTEERISRYVTLSDTEEQERPCPGNFAIIFEAVSLPRQGVRSSPPTGENSSLPAGEYVRGGAIVSFASNGQEIALQRGGGERTQPL